MKKLAGSKWMMSGLIIMSILVLAGAYVGFHRVTTRADTYCAELPDAIGLFPGNPVTLRGVPIGSVNRIDNGGDIAKVTFSIDHKYALPIGAQATSIAPSVIAVRQLALIGDDLGGERLPPGRCIGRDRTSTPSSIAEALQSVNKLARELTADADPDQSAKVMASLNSISREMDGIGPIVNNLLKQLAVPARTPITGALADMATTLDHTSVLANGLADNWGTLQSLVEAVNAVTDPIVVPVVNAMTRIAYALPEILVSAASLVNRYQHFAWPTLDAIVPVVRLIGAGFRNWGDLLGILPGFIRAFHIAFDQKTLGLRINYEPPRTRIPAKNPRLTCANVNRFLPGQCKVVAPDAMELDALRALLLFTGAGRP